MVMDKYKICSRSWCSIKGVNLVQTYGQFCPLAQATQLLCERWTLLLIREFMAGSTRFSDLQRGVPLMSPTLLSARLKHLVNSGIIEHVEGNHAYQLTQAGKELQPVVEMLGVWGHHWAQTDLNRGDLDAGLLMWDMRRSVDPAIFPAHRVIVQFEYPDAARGTRDWWLISEDGNVDLCLKDPGYDVDVVIKCPLKVMTAIWTCQKGFNESAKKGEVVVMGDPVLAGKLQGWLRASALSRLGASAAAPVVDWGVPS
jgi:DNA-binding HxlR family transcriptional regulator